VDFRSRVCAGHGRDTPDENYSAEGSDISDRKSGEYERRPRRNWRFRERFGLSLSPKRKKGLRIDDTFDEPSVEVRLSTPYASQDEGIEIETPVEDDSHSMEFEHRTFSFVVYLDLSHPISFLINDGG
jgi:hypothetical protein